VQIKEGLARLRLQGLPLVLPAKLGDGLAFNPFSLQQDCLSVQSRRRRELYLPDSPGPPRALSPKKTFALLGNSSRHCRPKIRSDKVKTGR
jgi:hypothetical protein